jgi:hypothetical protein
VKWLAVAEPRTTDRRPALLAAALLVGYAGTLVAPVARDFFSFAIPKPQEAVLVICAFALWVPLIRTFWKLRLLERFLGTGTGTAAGSAAGTARA